MAEYLEPCITEVSAEFMLGHQVLFESPRRFHAESSETVEDNAHPASKTVEGSQRGRVEVCDDQHPAGFQDPTHLGQGLERLSEMNHQAHESGIEAPVAKRGPLAVFAPKGYVARSDPFLRHRQHARRNVSCDQAVR